MNNLKLPAAWPILICVILFIVLPLSTIPGLFDFIFLVLALITLAIVAMLAISFLARRSSAQ
jgi:hypothetical protein